MKVGFHPLFVNDLLHEANYLDTEGDGLGETNCVYWTLEPLLKKPSVDVDTGKLFVYF